MESAEAVDKKCSRCGKNPPSTGNPWCRQCRTDHERQRQATQAEMMQARWFQAGANALRLQVARMFARAPGATFEGTAIAKYIMEFPSPDFDTAKKEPPAQTGG